MRILLVEDETRLARMIQHALHEQGHAVDVTETGEEALDWIHAAHYDAVVLDLMLPGIDGFETCRRLRSQGVSTPVLVLTARDAIADRVAGLDAGADDYLLKPFAFAELFARLRALSRRPREAMQTILRVGEVKLDPAVRRVWHGERELALTNKEYLVLECLMRRPGQVLTRSMIGDYVWDYEFANVTNVIDVHIRRLRHKLGDPAPGRLIQTVRGAGYRMNPDG